MRVGLFTDTYPPFVNGVSTSVLMLKKGLEKKGHEVYVITTNDDAFKYDFDEEEKVLRVPGLPIGIYDYRLSGVYPVRALNRIKKWKLDIIHSHTEFSVGIFARFVAKQLNIPLVHTYHTMYEDYVYYITKGYFDKASKQAVKYLSLFYCDKTADSLIVPTEKTKQLFQDKYDFKKEIYVIPTGIEIDRFYEDNIDKVRLKELKKDLKISDKDFVIVYVGRVAQEKNIHLLINAHKELVKKHKNIKLIIVGDGPDLPIFVQEAEDKKIKNIYFTGKVPWVDTPYYYHLGKIFGTASTSETQGLTVIEAMASGLLVLAINDEAFNNSINDQKDGIIFNNEEDYINKVLELYDNEELLKKISKEALKTSQKFSNSFYAKEVLEVYEGAIKRNKSFLRKYIENILKGGSE